MAAWVLYMRGVESRSVPTVIFLFAFVSLAPCTWRKSQRMKCECRISLFQADKFLGSCLLLYEAGILQNKTKTKSQFVAFLLPSPGYDLLFHSHPKLPYTKLDTTGHIRMQTSSADPDV